MKFQNCIITQKSWSFKKLCFPGAQLLQKSFCSYHSAPPFRGRERIRHGRISKKWLDSEKILENFGSFPGKGILNIHYRKFCQHGGKRLVAFIWGYPGVKLLPYSPKSFSLAPTSVTNFLHGPC